MWRMGETPTISRNVSTIARQVVNIQTMLTGDAWLDASTDKLSMTDKKSSTANAITPLIEGGWGMIRGVRVLCGGQVVEELNDYSRLHELIHMIKANKNPFKIDIITSFLTAE